MKLEINSQRSRHYYQRKIHVSRSRFFNITWLIMILFERFFNFEYKCKFFEKQIQVQEFFKFWCSSSLTRIDWIDLSIRALAAVTQTIIEWFIFCCHVSVFFESPVEWSYATLRFYELGRWDDAIDIESCFSVGIATAKATRQASEHGRLNVSEQLAERFGEGWTGGGANSGR